MPATNLTKDALNLGATLSSQIGGRYITALPLDATATDGAQNPALFIYSSSDRVDSAGSTRFETVVKLHTTFNPVAVSRGVNNPSYIINNAPPMTTIDAVDTLLLRNIGAAGAAIIASTQGPTDKINRTEMSMTDSDVNFLTVSGVNPNDPDNLLGGAYTAINNAADGTKLNGVKEIHTKNVLSPTTSYLMRHDNTGGVNTFKIQKNINGTISTIATFK
jgi:hypothetical protein